MTKATPPRSLMRTVIFSVSDETKTDQTQNSTNIYSQNSVKVMKTNALNIKPTNKNVHLQALT